MSLDLSQDYLVFDDPVTVSYQVKTGESTFGTPGGATYAEPVTVEYVYQESITAEDVVKNRALLQGSKGAFHLWTGNLSDIVPGIADLITVDGETWVVKVVLELDRDDNGIQRYRCACLQVE